MLDDTDEDAKEISDEGIDISCPRTDLAVLESVDSKYNAMRCFLIKSLEKNHKEKFVVFAFFKGTLNYLYRRLKAEGIRAILLHGDSGNDRDDTIDRFADPSGPSVLLSSELGSEGIDLQFCRFLVNYDLPWNPMRVEQRIGRLDRLGQKSKRISIINLQVANTIEDRVVMRLYERINVFRESIGDLEDILGQMTKNLVLELLNPDLSDDERIRNADASATALANKKAQQECLEFEAVNLVGFSDYIMRNIEESREHGRWLSAAELISFVEDFFAKSYPGTRIDPENAANNRLISLSDEAKRDLTSFISRQKPSTRTRLNSAEKAVLCVFDPRRAVRLPPLAEFIDTTYPMI